MKKLSANSKSMQTQSPPAVVKIRSLRPNVTRDEAIRLFQPSGATKLLRTVMSGPLRSVAEAYLPFYLFRVTIVNRGRTETSVMGLDAVRGSLDPYRFEHMPTDGETIRLETRNSVPPRLAALEAGELLMAKVRRLIYGKGFFRLQAMEILAEPLHEELHIPYWLGFSGSGGQARLKVLDGVRRRPEGGKVRSIFEAWLTDAAENRP
jgi:hypothetical protein